MGLLDPLAAIGKTLIDQLGTELTLRRVTTGEGDPTTGERLVGDTTTDYETKGALGRWSESRLGADGVEVAGGLQVTVPPLDDITPKSDDLIIIKDTVTAKVVDVLPIYAGDVPAAFELRCTGV